DACTVYALARRASAPWAARDLVAALADFSRAVDLDGEWVWVRNGRGLVYHDHQDYDAALADFTESLNLDQNHAATYEYRAESLYKLGRRAEAIAHLNAAIPPHPP